MTKRQRKKESDKAKAEHYAVKTEPHYAYDLGKRAYLPFVVTSTCPECGATVTRDLTDSYLSNPVLDVENEEGFSHEVDTPDGKYVTHSWSICLIPRMTLEVDGLW